MEKELTLRVYYADTDAQGVVYHANYLRFFESARTEYLRALGIELSELVKDQGVQFAVVELNIKYHKPAYLDDKLLLVSRISKIGYSSVIYQQEIYQTDRSGILLCNAEVRLVTVDVNMRPCVVPKILPKILNGEIK